MAYQTFPQGPLAKQLTLGKVLANDRENQTITVQPYRSKPLMSTQGHAFRVRAAANRRLLTAHTLNDLVIRSCDDEEEPPQLSASEGVYACEACRAQRCDRRSCHIFISVVIFHTIQNL